MKLHHLEHFDASHIVIFSAAVLNITIIELHLIKDELKSLNVLKIAKNNHLYLVDVVSQSEVSSLGTLGRISYHQSRDSNCVQTLWNCNSQYNSFSFYEN